MQVFSFSGKPVAAPAQTVRFSVDAVQKQGYAHFMLKEIHEQPAVIARILKSRLRGDEVVLDGLNLTDRQLRAFKQIYIVACGTAYHAGLVGEILAGEGGDRAGERGRGQ